MIRTMWYGLFRCHHQNVGWDTSNSPHILWSCARNLEPCHIDKNYNKLGLRQLSHHITATCAEMRMSVTNGSRSATYQRLVRLGRRSSLASGSKSWGQTRRVSNMKTSPTSKSSMNGKPIAQGGLGYVHWRRDRWDDCWACGNRLGWCYWIWILIWDIQSN